VVSNFLVVLIGLFTSEADRTRKAGKKRQAENPGVVMAEGASITATVEAIDYDQAQQVDSEGTQGQCCHAQGRSGGEEL